MCLFLCLNLQIVLSDWSKDIDNLTRFNNYFKRF